MVLRRWWWLLLAGAIIGGAVAYGATKVLASSRYDALAVVSSGTVPLGQSGAFFSSPIGADQGDLLPDKAALGEVQRMVPGVSTAALDDHMTAEASTTSCVTLDPSGSGPGCRLLLLHVQWTDAARVQALANALATVFVRQERVRIQRGYALYHRALVAQEGTITRAVSHSTGAGPAQTWLQTQYANSLSDLYGKDATARVQADIAAQSLNLAVPARVAVLVTASKSKTNALLGALVGLLLAWALAFFATTSYDGDSSAQGGAPIRRVADERYHESSVDAG